MKDKSYNKTMESPAIQELSRVNSFEEQIEIDTLDKVKQAAKQFLKLRKVKLEKHRELIF